MRTIKEMLGSSEKVWVYISDRAAWEKFADTAQAEGFGFSELPREKWAFGHTVAVHSNGSMGHLPLFIWCRSFGSGIEDCPKKVDISRYLSSDEDFICRESHFRKVS